MRPIPSLSLLSVALVLLGLFGGAGCHKSDSPDRPTEAAAPPPAPTPTGEAAGGRLAAPALAGSPTSFKEVSDQLDPGGTLFLYLSTARWLSGLSSNLVPVRDLILSMPGPAQADASQIEAGFDFVGKLIKDSGVEDLSGVGLSAAEVAPGLFRSKLMIHHPASSAKGFMWTLAGRPPHALTGMDLLPPDTALGMFGDLDLARGWAGLQRALKESGIPELAAAADEIPKQFEGATRLDLSKVLASLGGEWGMILTFDDTQTVPLPLVPGSQPLEMPVPSLLLALKVKDDLLFDRVSAELKGSPDAVTREEKGLKWTSMPLPNPLQIPLQLTAARGGDYFYFATSPDLVLRVHETGQGKRPGLKATPAFQNLLKFLPTDGNQFSYVGERFAKTIAELQQQIFRQSRMPEAQVAMMTRLFGSPESATSLAVGRQLPNGWLTTSMGNRDESGALLLAPVAGVAAVGAGMLLPALAKAKSKAQSINTVNQLKQLGLAARIYATDHKDQFPPAENWCEALQPYLGSTKVLKAPNDPRPSRCSYAYNAKLSGMNEGKINPSTVVFFEANTDWNGNGGQELLLSIPRAPGVYVVGLADGSVQQVPVSNMASLRWDP